MLQYVTPPLQMQTSSNMPEQQKIALKDAEKNKKERIDRYLKEGVHNIGASISDNGASSYYRIRLISRFLEQKYDLAVRAYDMPLLFPPEMIERMESIRVQRANTLKTLPWLRKCFMPMKHRHPEIKLIYDTDDCLILKDLPKYNRTRNYFDLDRGVISEFMDCSDYVTVSTRRLKNYYVKNCSVDPAKIIVRPNRPAKFFFADYDSNVVLNRLRSLKKRKPRICFSCTSTHIDQLNLNNGYDDFSGINQWIIEHRKKYQFVFLMDLPPALLPYADDFEIHETVPFISYRMKRMELEADLYIQPLEKNIFNECKSAIKLHEAWAIGVPILVQDIGIYKETDPQACFADAEELDLKVNRLFAQPEEQVIAAIRANFDRLEPLWLENTYEEWLPVLFNIDGIAPSW